MLTTLIPTPSNLIAMNKNTEIIHKEQITDFLLLILRIATNEVGHSNDFEKELQKRLKFQKKTDWKRFRASVDLLDDTEYAIISAFMYQLGDLENGNNDYGETNIRLYGILNAVYLQMNAFEEIAVLLHYSSRNEIRQIFNDLDIYKLRGIAGAHTVDYEYSKTERKENSKINKTTSFRIVQMKLEKTGGKITVVDENDICSEFNLIKILSEYEKIATDLLIKFIRFAIKSLIKTKEKKIEIEKDLNELVPKLIDYKTLDKNKDYWKREYKKFEKEIEKFYSN